MTGRSLPGSPGVVVVEVPERRRRSDGKKVSGPGLAKVSRNM